MKGFSIEAVDLDTSQLGSVRVSSDVLLMQR